MLKDIIISGDRQRLSRVHALPGLIVFKCIMDYNHNQYYSKLMFFIAIIIIITDDM